MRMDAISFGLQPEAAAPNEYRALALGTAIVSAGITDTFDFEAGAQLFLRDTFTSSGSDHTDSGIGDVSLRVKWTFWKDPSSGEAAAVIPYVLVPTNSSAVAGSNYTQGGIIVPWTLVSAAGFKAGAMVEWDELRNEANTRYDTRWYGSAYAQWDLAHTVGVYGEATASAPRRARRRTRRTIGGGATLSVSEQLPVGLRGEPRARARAKPVDPGPAVPLEDPLGGPRQPSSKSVRIENLKVEPSPTRLSTEIVPPISSQRRLEMMRPKPVPPGACGSTRCRPG
jgi:hypothetical protein